MLPTSDRFVLSNRLPCLLFVPRLFHHDFSKFLHHSDDVIQVIFLTK